MWAAKTRVATPFCQGLSKEVLTGLIFSDRTATGTSNPYFPSRSEIRDLGADPRRKCLPQLSDDPQARRVLGDVEVQNTPPIVADGAHSTRARGHDLGLIGEVHASHQGLKARVIAQAIESRIDLQQIDLSADFCRLLHNRKLSTDPERYVTRVW
jgi:hypothetical protein